MRLFGLVKLLLHSANCISHNGDGTGGSAPPMHSYVMLNADISGQYIGADPHAVHGLITKENNNVLVGFGLQSESSTKFAGFVTRIDLCEPVSQYENPFGTTLTAPGSNCKTKFKWSFLNKNSGRNLKLAWVAESPDGSYILSAGVRQKSTNANKFNGYVVKLNASTGAKIWEFDIGHDAGALAGGRSGFETIAFTEDGGFIVGGFMNRGSTEFPYFKSSGQVDDGTPVMHKFSAETANAASMASSPTPVWTYKCTGSNQCDIRYGSAKAVRVYKDNGVEKVVTVPGPRSVFIIVDAATGQELAYKVFDNFAEGENNGDGTANDVAVELDSNGNVAGFVTNGLDFHPVNKDNGVACGEDGCMRIRGVFTKFKADLSGKVWQTRFNTGDWAGGKYQFANQAASQYESLVYTECFSIQKVLDGVGNHVGYLGGCGSGIEGCDFHPGAIKTACKNDPRVNWRAVSIRMDLDGNIVWYRMDNFKEPEINNRVDTSANEFGLMRPDGKFVALTDELMGFGVLTLECESGVTCPGDGTTTQTSPTTKTTVTTPTETSPTGSTSGTGSTPTFSTSTTGGTGTTPTFCPEMKWKGKKATKMMYKGAKDGKRSYIIRQTILNNSNFHPNIRESQYAGFFMFSRRYCGIDFFNALSDGTIKLGMYDYHATYDLKFKHTRVDGSKGSSVTFQYMQEFVGQEDAPWSKRDGNSAKKDQFFLSIDNVPDTFDASKEADCFNLLTGVLPNGNDIQNDWTECASTQKDAGF